jgi:hypothetical protein
LNMSDRTFAAWVRGAGTACCGGGVAAGRAKRVTSSMARTAEALGKKKARGAEAGQEER